MSGVLWRCVLQPPLTIYQYQKGGQPTILNDSVVCQASYPVRVARHLPPRVSFRKAANKQVREVFSWVFFFFFLRDFIWKTSILKTRTIKSLKEEEKSSWISLSGYSSNLLIFFHDSIAYRSFNSRVPWLKISNFSGKHFFMIKKTVNTQWN